MARSEIGSKLHRISRNSTNSTGNRFELNLTRPFGSFRKQIFRRSTSRSRADQYCSARARLRSPRGPSRLGRNWREGSWIMSWINCAFLRISGVSSSRRERRVIGGGIGRSRNQCFALEFDGSLGSDDKLGRIRSAEGTREFCHAEGGRRLKSMSPCVYRERVD